MHKKKILLVDDDTITLRVLSIALGVDNFEIFYAQDAVQAIDATLQEKPDLTILDLGLPGGDGYLVMEQLANLTVNPIIVLSSREESENKQKTIKAGAIAYFQKPPDMKILLKTIKKLL